MLNFHERSFSLLTQTFQTRVYYLDKAGNIREVGSSHPLLVANPVVTCMLNACLYPS